MARKINRRAIPVTITIDGELLQVLDNLADAQRLSRSQLICRMIDDGLEGEKVTAALLSNRSVMEVMGKVFSDPKTLQAVGGALGREMSHADAEKFNRDLRIVADQAAETLEAGKGRKGRKS